MMSGKENYTRAIEFSGPEYLPCQLWAWVPGLYEKDEAKAKRIEELQLRFTQDHMGVSATLPGEEPVERDGARHWTDEWGTGWADDGHGAKTETYPMESSYDLMETYPFPDPRASGRFDNADEQLKSRGDFYVLASVWFTLFERLWMLRGFNNMLMDPYIEEANFFKLRDRVLDYNLAMIDQFLERGVDGFFFSDDWGCQRSLLMDPDDWRKYYKDAYRQMFERARAGGAHVWMHLCGNVTVILPDLVEAGLNVLNPVQPQAMDVKELSRDFGGKLCFFGGVDVQGTLIHGTPDDVKQEVHKLIDLFGRFNGGYIGCTSHSVMPETPLDNVIAMYEAFLEHRG